MTNINQNEILITLPVPDAALDDLRQLSSRLRITHQVTRHAEDISPEQWAQAEILYTDMVLPDPAAAPNLRWVQFHYAGIEFMFDTPMAQAENVVFTSLSGANAPQAAEYAVTVMLALGHHMTDLFEAQEKADWIGEKRERILPRELRGSTVGLVGYGSVSRELARLLSTFEVTILAAKRDARHPEDTGYTIPGLGDPEGNYFHRLYPMEARKAMLKECDFVVVCLPITAETRNTIGEAELAVMKPDAFLVNLGRGGVVNQSAMLTALQERRLGGAALDVFTEEPLPASSPLWHLPNVIVTPHIAGISPFYRDRALRLFTENLRRYLNGQTLLNQVDPQKGY
jgi:phosphoglycerate dehydrogenase-like enzyme